MDKSAHNTRLVDVARRAGVSASTVSRSLTRQELVRPETRQQVLKIIKEMAYTPHPLARGLITGKSYTIGLVVPTLSNLYYGQIAEGCEKAVRNKGYNLILASSSDRHSIERKAVDMFLRRRVDGLIIAGSLDPEEVARLSPGSTPVVFTSQSTDSFDGFDYVLIDDALGARLACGELLSCGHDRLALITGPEASPTSKRRLRGVRSELEEIGVSIEGHYIRCGVFSSFESGFRAMDALIGVDPTPTGVFAFSDTLAAGAIRAIQQRGLRVPGDIGVVGFGDTPFAAYLSPRLTTIKSSGFELGQKAAESILSRIDTPEQPPVRLVLPVEIVRRESC
jgi:DNA-binding LacI/PurR family transcriptional regulator